MVARIPGLALAALLALVAFQSSLAANVPCDASCLRSGGICEQVAGVSLCVRVGRLSRRLLQDAVATGEVPTETLDLGAAAAADPAATPAATDAAAASVEDATEITTTDLAPVEDVVAEEVAGTDNAIAQNVTPDAAVAPAEDAANNPVATDAPTAAPADAAAEDATAEEIAIPGADSLQPADDAAAGDAAAADAAAGDASAEEIDVSAITPVEDETNTDTGAYDPATVAANEQAVEAAAGGVEEGAQATGFAAFWNSTVNKLSPGAIAGIVIGVLAGVALIVGGSVWACRRRRRNRFDQFATGAATEGYSKYTEDPDAAAIKAYVANPQPRV